jgi:hypothetical protein
MQFFSRLVIRPETPLAEDFVAVGGRALRETASANYRTLPLLLPAPRADDQIPLLFATCGLHSEKKCYPGFPVRRAILVCLSGFPESPSGGIGIPGHDRMDNLLNGQSPKSSQLFAAPVRNPGFGKSCHSVVTDHRSLDDPES